MKICQQIPNFVKVTQKYRAPYLKTQVFCCGSNVKSPQNTPFE